VSTQESILGRCVVLPFDRGSSDFESCEGEDLVRSAIRCLLSTTCASPRGEGEVVFNQRFGTLLESVRHSPMDDPTTLELIQYYIEDSIEINEPRVVILAVSTIRDPTNNKVTIRVKYNVITRDVAGNRVAQRDLALEVNE